MSGDDIIAVVIYGLFVLATIALVIAVNRRGE
jgi:hypothetical protein